MKTDARHASVIILPVLAALGSVAFATQDKYTVRVPNGLAFSEFQGVRGLADRRRQPVGRRDGCDPRQSRDDRCLPGGPASPATASSSPTKPQDGESPLADDTERGSPCSDNGAGHPERHRFYGEGQQALPGHRWMGIRPVRRRSRVRHFHAAWERRCVRGRVPYDSAGEGLRFHGVSEAVNGDWADGLSG